MAIKDWKRDKKEENPNQIIYGKGKKDEDDLYSKSITIFKIDNQYEVLFWKGDTLGKEKYFKTKQQALKYARAYMRNN